MSSFCIFEHYKSKTEIRTSKKADMIKVVQLMGLYTPGMGKPDMFKILTDAFKTEVPTIRTIQSVPSVEFHILDHYKTKMEIRNSKKGDMVKVVQLMGLYKAEMKKPEMSKILKDAFKAEILLHPISEIKPLKSHFVKFDRDGEPIVTQCSMMARLRYQKNREEIMLKNKQRYHSNKALLQKDDNTPRGKEEENTVAPIQSLLSVRESSVERETPFIMTL